MILVINTYNNRTPIYNYGMIKMFTPPDLMKAMLSLITRYACCVSQEKGKERRKGEEGAINSYIFQHVSLFKIFTMLESAKV